MRKFIILITAALVSANTFAQDALTLDQVRDMALQHNHKAKDAALTIQIAEQAVKQYRANFFPSIDLNGIAAYGTSKSTLFAFPLSQYSGLASLLIGEKVQLPDIDLTLKLGWVVHGGVQFTQPIFMGGKIIAANKIAKRSLAMAKQNQRLTDTEIIEKADEAFFNVVRATELLTVANKYHELLAELERNVKSAVDIGMKLPADLLRVQVKKNEVELNQRRAENGLRLANMNLNYVIGAPLTTPTAINYTAFTNADTALTSANPDALAAGERPEAVIMREKAEIARQQVNVVRADALPSVALMATYGYTRGLKLNDNNLFDGGSFLGGVTVKIPVFHFGERLAKIRAAKLRLQQAENERDNVNEQLQLALAKAQNGYDEAKLEIELSELSVRQAQQSLDMTRHQYDNGMATLSDLLDAQALWQKSQQTRIDALCNLQTATTALSKAFGTLR
ncbi:MAG: TolC family protein [Bacteroidaceae bacterium]|nr:TolC family protein [Bacteroidaceae bacterium]